MQRTGETLIVRMLGESVMIFRFWYLTGNDRTLVLERPVTLSSTSGHYLNVLMTVEIGQSAFEADDTWQASGDWMLGSYVRSLSSDTFGHYLNILMTVEIGRSAFEADDTWQASGDWTLGSCVWSI